MKIPFFTRCTEFTQFQPSACNSLELMANARARSADEPAEPCIFPAFAGRELHNGCRSIVSIPQRYRLLIVAINKRNKPAGAFAAFNLGGVHV